MIFICVAREKSLARVVIIKISKMLTRFLWKRFNVGFYFQNIQLLVFLSWLN